MNYQEWSKIHKCSAITESINAPLFCEERFNGLKNNVTEYNRNGDGLISCGMQAYARQAR